jgi:hypothetical protein
MAGININPMTVSNAAGFFGVKSDGLYQGVTMDDPAIRNSLVAGRVALTETLPMFGGIAIQEIPKLDLIGIGNDIKRALQYNQITGFSVFDQGSNGMVTPQSNVPAYMAGMSIGYYRIGSKARINFACTNAVIAQLANGVAPGNLVWQQTGQCIDTYHSGAQSVSISSASYVSSTNIATITTASAHGLSVGDYVTIAGITIDTNYNGTVQVLSVTSTTAFTYNPITTPVSPGLGAAGTIAAPSATVAAALALPVSIIGAQQGNSKIVNYNASTGYANWVVNGNACTLVI